MACYVCHYKKLNCTEGCPLARFFDEGNISTYNKISRFQRHTAIKDMLRPCGMEEGQDLIRQQLAQAEAGILHLDLCNPCQFLEVFDCKGEQCDFRKYFDTEAGLAKLEAIANLKTKKFIVSNFRKAGGKKAERVDAWYEEAVRVSTVEVPAYEEDKALFNRVKEAMGVGWVKNEFRAFVISITNKAGAAQAAAQPTNEVVAVENEGAEEEVAEEEEEVRKEADSEEVDEPEAVAEEEVEPEAVTEEVGANNEAEAASALVLLPELAEEEVEPEAVTGDVEARNEAASTLVLLPAPAGRCRRRASILAEQRIAAIYRKEDEEDNEDED